MILLMLKYLLSTIKHFIFTLLMIEDVLPLILDGFKFCDILLFNSSLVYLLHNHNDNICLDEKDFFCHKVDYCHGHCISLHHVL